MRDMKVSEGKDLDIRANYPIREKLGISDCIKIETISPEPTEDKEKRVGVTLKAKVKLDEIKLHAALVCGAYESNYNIKLATYILCNEFKDNDSILSLLTMIGLDDPGNDIFDFTEELREIYAK